mgnify:FL=1
MFEIPDIQLNQYGKPARIMFLAPYAPDAPDFSKKPYTGNGGYPQYHYNIYKAIQDIGYDVVSSSKPYSVQFAKGNVDYVFSLMNRFAMSRPEIFISSYCEFIQVPYLGAPPNIRAIAEDKFLTKMVFRSLELNVPEGIGLSEEKGIPAQAPFPGPYFVKKRFGAASGGIREDRVTLDYVPLEYPAIPSRKMVQAEIEACESLGVAYKEGLTLSAGTMYPGSGFETARGVLDQSVLDRVHLWKKVGAANVDIETTTVLTMTRLYDMHGGALLGIGNDTSSGEGEFLDEAVIDRMAHLGLKTLHNLKI